MVEKIKDNYLALNIYNHSQFLNGVVNNLAFDLESDIDDLMTLCDIHFIINCSKYDMKYIFKKILDNFARSTEQEVLLTKGAIKGTIDWNATYKKRISNGFNDPTIFVTRNSNKIYDVKENQLLKYLLNKIRQKIKNLESVIDFNSESQWIIDIKTLNLLVHKMLSHPKLKEVTLNKSFSYDAIKSTSKHREKQYRKIAEIGNIYHSIYIKKNALTLFEVIKNQVLVPQNDDKIYEFLVLFNVLSILEEMRRKHNGKREIRLLRTKKNSIFIYEFLDKIIKVNYQCVPKPFARSSQYKKVIEAYGISSKSRIPDIIIEVEDRHNYRAGIIEVKYSEQRSYIGQGVQDVQAYLEDYKELLTKAPKAMLVTWNAVNIRPSDESTRDLWITNEAILYESIKDYINLIL